MQLLNSINEILFGEESLVNITASEYECLTDVKGIAGSHPFAEYLEGGVRTLIEDKGYTKLRVNRFSNELEETVVQIHNSYNNFLLLSIVTDSTYSNINSVMHLNNSNQLVKYDRDIYYLFNSVLKVGESLYIPVNAYTPSNMGLKNTVADWLINENIDSRNNIVEGLGTDSDLINYVEELISCVHSIITSNINSKYKPSLGASDNYINVYIYSRGKVAKQEVFHALRTAHEDLNTKLQAPWTESDQDSIITVMREVSESIVEVRACIRTMLNSIVDSKNGLLK